MTDNIGSSQVCAMVAKTTIANLNASFIARSIAQLPYKPKRGDTKPLTG
jgi:hypothetical protein